MPRGPRLMVAAGCAGFWAGLLLALGVSPEIAVLVFAGIILFLNGLLSKKFQVVR